tara:strand:+ start:404 stop:1183 length:780 start_codon:yes stop_codon:yes gene_type:complete
MKTPIKDPNTFVCSEVIKNLIPIKTKVKSLLLFSGQLEIPLAYAGYDIEIATNKFVIYEFWNCALRDPYLISKMAKKVNAQIGPQLVYLYQNDWPRFKDPYYRSALFFLLNRYSTTGTISHGQFRTDNFTPLSTQNLERFCEDERAKKINIKYYNSDKYLDAFGFIEDDDVVLLPIGKLSLSPLNKITAQGHETYNMNDNELRDTLKKQNKKFVLIYKSNPRLLSFYKDYNIIMVNNFGAETKKLELAEDIIITNLEIR